MRLSTEAIVAAAVAIAFAALSIGAIAAEQNEHATRGPANNAALSQISAGSTE